MAVPVALGVLAAWFVFYGFVLSGLQEHADQGRLYARYRLQLALATAPPAEPIKAGAPVAMIEAPAAHIHNVVVVEGTTSRLLAQGPGHLRDTPLPGQAGTAVIMGRSVTFGAPFRDITGMRIGDMLTVTDGDGVFVYRVEDVRVPGTSLPPPLQANQSRLTLVTSASNGWRSGWAPTHAVYVDALLVHGQVVPATGGTPATVSGASLPMHSDSSALVAIIFWLEGLLLVAGLAIWSWARWGRPQTWIAGAPVFLFVLWGATGALMRFLPNLL